MFWTALVGLLFSLNLNRMAPIAVSSSFRRDKQTKIYRTWHDMTWQREDIQSRIEGMRGGETWRCKCRWASSTTMYMHQLYSPTIGSMARIWPLFRKSHSPTKWLEHPINYPPPAPYQDVVYAYPINRLIYIPYNRCIPYHKFFLHYEKITRNNILYIPYHTIDLTYLYPLLRWLRLQEGDELVAQLDDLIRMPFPLLRERQAQSKQLEVGPRHKTSGMEPGDPPSRMQQRVKAPFPLVPLRWYNNTVGHHSHPQHTAHRDSYIYIYLSIYVIQPKILYTALYTYMICPTNCL